MPLHFLGTCHDDPLGPQRLRLALEIEQPDIIAVEGSEAWERYLLDEGGNAHHRRKIERARQQGLSKEAHRFALWLTENITLYESRVSREYALESDIPVLFVDNNRFIEEDKKRVQEDLTPKGIVQGRKIL